MFEHYFVSKGGWLKRLLLASEGKAASDLLFVSTKQEPLRNSNFHNRVWSKARIQAGEPELRIHDLRHTAASLAVASGANVKAVQEMLGHASAQMTLDRYAGLFDGHLDDVADRMDAAFAHMESDSEVTEPDSGVNPRIAGATNSIALQRFSIVAPRRFELPTQGLGNLCSIP